MRKYLTMLLMFMAFSGLPINVAYAQESYYIPPNRFNAALQVMDLGFSNIFGLFQNATGSFTFEESTKTVSHVRLAIDTSSLMASNVDNQRALAALLDTVRFPEMTVTANESFSFAEGKADIKANMTLHGVTKPIILTATLNRSGRIPRDSSRWVSKGTILGLSMRGDIKRADFGLTGDPDNGDNADRFGDTITLMLETQAIRQ